MSPLTTSISRRDFLQKAGAAAALVGLASVFGLDQAEAASGETADDKAWGVLIDLTRCTGCNSCALACKESNQLPNPEREPDRLSSDAYSFVDQHQAITPTGGREDMFVKRQCMHCLHPGCASACTVGALRKTPEGPVIYDAGKCIGCRYCQYACPFSVPSYDWQNPLGLIHKCQMCKERLASGDQPACSAACPTGAVQFGRRKDLLAQAHARITSSPDRYIDHVYGEHEIGGTSMLYLSEVPFQELGFPALPDQAVSHYAEPVMTKTPFVALTVATVATGLHFGMKHRGERLDGHDEANNHDTTHSETL